MAVKIIDEVKIKKISPLLLALLFVVIVSTISFYKKVFPTIENAAVQNGFSILVALLMAGLFIGVVWYTQIGYQLILNHEALIVEKKKMGRGYEIIDTLMVRHMQDVVPEADYRGKIDVRYHLARIEDKGLYVITMGDRVIRIQCSENLYRQLAQDIRKSRQTLQKPKKQRRNK